MKTSIKIGLTAALCSNAADLHKLLCTLLHDCKIGECSRIRPYYAEYNLSFRLNFPALIIKIKCRPIEL